MLMPEQAERGHHATHTDWRSSELWRALDGMRIEPAGAALTFTARLARENGWTQSYAQAVVQDYKRFLYLAAHSPQPVTPSDEVDQAWHLHLAYSRHYWDVLCGQILERRLHHGPTEGGEAEGARYWRQYEETLQLYRSVFGQEPPAEIWPSAKVRFSGRTLRIDAERYWLVPRRLTGRSATLAAGALLAACSAAAAEGGQESSGIDFETFVIVLVFVVVTALAMVSGTKRRDKENGCGGGGCGGSGSGDGCGGGGCGGCGG